MKDFISFDDFIFERELFKFDDLVVAKYDYKKNLIDALIETKTLIQEEQFILESISDNNLYYELWEDTLPESFFQDSINENKFAEWIADKGESAKELIKAGGKKAKDKAVQLKAKLLGSFSAFAKFILGNIKKFLVSAFDYLKKEVEKKYAGIKDKVVERASKSLDGKADELSDEVKNLGTMTKAAAAWVTGGAIKTVGSEIKQAANVDVSESFKNILWEGIVESVRFYGAEFISEILTFNTVNEGGKDSVTIPGLSKLAHIIASLPGYKQLHKLEKAAAKKSNKLLNKFSHILSSTIKSPGPFEFTLMGTIVGLALGYKLEHEIHHGIDHLLHKLGHKGAMAAIATAIPIVAFIVSIAFKIATALWYYSVGQAVVGAIKGKKKGEENKEE